MQYKLLPPTADALTGQYWHCTILSCSAMYCKSRQCSHLGPASYPFTRDAGHHKKYFLIWRPNLIWKAVQGISNGIWRLNLVWFDAIQNTIRCKKEVKCKEIGDQKLKSDACPLHPPIFLKKKTYFRVWQYSVTRRPLNDPTIAQRSSSGWHLPFIFFSFILSNFT